MDFKAIKLPTDYCRIIGTAGTPPINIFAIDLTFIDTAMAELTKNNILTRDTYKNHNKVFFTKNGILYISNLLINNMHGNYKIKRK